MTVDEAKAIVRVKHPDACTYFFENAFCIVPSASSEYMERVSSWHEGWHDGSASAWIDASERIQKEQ